jgi:DNA-binding MarR family transcriptional regulator
LSSQWKGRGKLNKPHGNHDETLQHLDTEPGTGTGSGAATTSKADFFTQTSQVVHAFHRAFQARLGLSGAEWRFLMMLLQHHERMSQHHSVGNETPEHIIARLMNEGISQKEMQELLGIDRAMVTRLAKQFEAEGLIRRAPDPNDNRLTILYLTEAGMRMHYDIPRKLAVFWQEATQGMSSAEIEGLHHALLKLNTNLAVMAGQGDQGDQGDKHKIVS